MKPKVLVLTGYGINCDYETQFAFSSCGAEAHRLHIHDLISRKHLLREYQIFVLPGGFSFGDDLGSGKVLAIKLASYLQEALQDFIDDGKLVLGICNGFQVLVRLGILPGAEKSFEQTTTLTFNASGRFENRWVYLSNNVLSPCVFTKGIGKLYLPVRHGEGRFLTKSKTILKNLIEHQQIALQYVDKEEKKGGYPWNPNGSQNNVAGICNRTGRIFGLMPHPEAFLSFTNHPRWTRKRESVGTALQLFSNAIHYAKGHL